MNRRQPSRLVRWSVWLAAVLAVLGLVALPSVAAGPAVSALPSGLAAVSSTAQDWTDLFVGFGLLSAFSLGLMGWWFTRSGLRFK